MFPPGFIFVLLRPPTPTFFLYKKPYGPYQNWPLDGPEPNADMYIYSIRKSLLEKASKILFPFSKRDFLKEIYNFKTTFDIKVVLTVVMQHMFP